MFYLIPYAGERERFGKRSTSWESIKVYAKYPFPGYSEIRISQEKQKNK